MNPYNTPRPTQAIIGGEYHRLAFAYLEEHSGINSKKLYWQSRSRYALRFC